MEKIPYLTSEVANNDAIINEKFDTKINYIQAVQAAINAEQDLNVYELLDQRRFQLELNGVELEETDTDLPLLVNNMHHDMGHYLATKLIAYLSEKFPFFYYEETHLGVFELYFGNWWGRRRFGILDPLSVSFIFDDQAYSMLSRAVEMAKNDERYHAAAIEETTKTNEIHQQLLDGQEERNAQRRELENKLAELGDKNGFFLGRGNSEEREEVQEELAKLDALDAKADEVPAVIAENNAKILEYSKEDTILLYEQRAINETFGSFTDFETAVSTLYADYLNALRVEGGK
ncbi:hypothetical protein OIT44_00135 [Weissella ceti]|uniref:Exonuclease SbcC n=1 Tax=Weissella ceti TaxID=759620 RepID=A0ABT3E252_9LACO|nr:hypothetical protein [Weissella ceti]MCW0952504.1 hypothetical protein [Weissella ceti]QVK11827.1 hypothetical protein KHQ31_06335 [Weissella ceti]